MALAATLQERTPLTADDALRVARLLLDAGATIPATLLVDAAWAANLAGDPGLGAELAARAVAGGGDVPATLALARANAMLERFEEAEAALAAIEAQMPGHESAVPYLEQRVRVLFWGLGRVDEMRALLERARSWSDDPGWQRELVPLSMPVVVASDLAGAVAAAEGVLADPELEPQIRRRLEIRYAMLLFYSGRWNEAHAAVRRSPPGDPDPRLLRADGAAGVSRGHDRVRRRLARPRGLPGTDAARRRALQRPRGRGAGRGRAGAPAVPARAPE